MPAPAFDHDLGRLDANRQALRFESLLDFEHAIVLAHRHIGRTLGKHLYLCLTAELGQVRLLQLVADGAGLHRLAHQEISAARLGLHAGLEQLDDLVRYRIVYHLANHVLDSNIDGHRLLVIGRPRGREARNNLLQQIEG